MMYGFYNREWIRELERLPKTERDKMLKSFGNQLVEHLLDMGFKEVWYCAMDEPSIPDATSAKTRNRLAFLKSLNTKLKLDVAINHYSPRLINALNNYIDVWVPTSSSGVCLALLNDIKSGEVHVSPATQVGFYQQCRYFSQPDKARRWGWLAALYGVEHYSIFAYNQTPHNAAYKLFVYDSKKNPKPTPALEGLRDGFEEYEYFEKLKTLTEKLSAKRNSLNKKKLAALKDAEKFIRDMVDVKRNTVFSFKTMPGGSGGGSWYDFTKPDRWQFLKVKGQVLKHIVELQKSSEGNNK